MKILYVTSEALLGGHVLSAFTIAKNMQQRNNNVSFAAGIEKLTPVIQKYMHFYEVKIPIFHGQRPTYFTWQSFQAVKDLLKIVIKCYGDYRHKIVVNPGAESCKVDHFPIGQVLIRIN